MRKRDPIPESFKTIGEAARFWDTHDSTDYEDLMRDVEVKVDSGNECGDGCGGRTSGGKYLPGHDQRHRTSLERRVGGLPGLSGLVDAADDYAQDRISLKTLGARVKEIFLMERKGP